MQATEGELIPATPPLKKEKRLRLGTVREIKRELIKIYTDAKRGKLPTQDASRLAFLLQTLVNMIKDDEFEQRIVALENAKNEKS